MPITILRRLDEPTAPTSAVSGGVSILRRLPDSGTLPPDGPPSPTGTAPAGPSLGAVPPAGVDPRRPAVPSWLAPGRRHEETVDGRLGGGRAAFRSSDTMGDLLGQATGELPRTDYYAEVTAPMPPGSRQGDIAANVGKSLQAGLIGATMGQPWAAVEMTFDALGMHDASAWAKQVRQQSDATREQLRAGQVAANEHTWAGWTERSVYGGVESIGAMIPSIVASIITKNPNIGLGMMGAGVGAEKYAELGESAPHLSQVRRFLHGVVEGGTEVITEKMPFEHLLGDLARGSGIWRTIRNQLATELPQEQIATFEQDANEWSAVNPGKPVAAFLAERPGRAYETLIATIVATVGMSSGSIALNRALNGPESSDVVREGVGGQAAREIVDVAEDRATAVKPPPQGPPGSLLTPPAPAEEPAPSPVAAAPPVVAPEPPPSVAAPVPAAVTGPSLDDVSGIIEPVAVPATEELPQPEESAAGETDMFGNPLTTASAEEGGAPHNPENPTPGMVATMSTDLIEADPGRFQFKQNTDRSGVTNEARIEGPWNDNRAGILLVWRDPEDEKTYVVNGHHRLEAGKRLGAEKMAVRFIEAADANEALVEGALTNIAEGRGTPVDVAKVVRDSGMDADGLQRAGVDPKKALARDGLALAKLSDNVFHRVAIGELAIPQAAAIGAANLSPEGQAAVVQLMTAQEAKGRTLTPGQVAELAQDVAGSAEVAVVDENQTSIFDVLGEEKTANTAVEKVVLRDWLKRELAKDRKLFGFVTKGQRAKELSKAGNVIDVQQSRQVAEEAAQVEAIFARLGNAAGPIATALNEAAVDLASGQKPDAVRPRLLAAVKAAVAQEFGGAARPTAQPRGDRSDRAGHPPDAAAGRAPAAGGRSADVTDAPRNDQTNESPLTEKRKAEGPPGSMTRKADPTLAERPKKTPAAPEIASRPGVRRGVLKTTGERVYVEPIGNGGNRLYDDQGRYAENVSDKRLEHELLGVRFDDDTTADSGPQSITAEALASTLNLPEDQAVTLFALIKSMLWDKLDRIRIVRGGAPGEGLYQSDRLPTGEEQPRLPGDVGAVRELEVPTPKEELPLGEFRLTAQEVKPRKAKQTTLFQRGDWSIVLLDDDTNVNASGESAASAEALSRVRGMRARGETFAMRTRGGSIRPLIGPDAVDTVAGPNQEFGIQRADGSFQVLSRGERRLYQQAAETEPHLQWREQDGAQTARFSVGEQNYVVAFADVTESIPEGGPRRQMTGTRDGGPVVDVSFALERGDGSLEQGLSGTGNARAVFRAVSLAVKDYRSVQRPAAFVLAAVEPSRKRLYRRVLAGIAEWVEPGSSTWIYRKFPDADVYTIRGDRTNQFFQAIETGAKGSVEFTADDAAALVRAFETSDISTGIHEIAHITRRWLLSRDVPQDMRQGVSDEDIRTAEEWAGAKDGEWDTKAEEKFARGLEHYLREGGPTLPTSMRAVFQKLAAWMRDIYQTVTGSAIDVAISPEMREVFDRLVTRRERVETKPKAAETPSAKPAKTAFTRGMAVEGFGSQGEVLTVNDFTGEVRVKFTSGPMVKEQGARGYYDMDPKDLQRRAPSGEASTSPEGSQLPVKPGAVPRPGGSLLSPPPPAPLAATGQPLSTLQAVELPELVEIATQLAETPSVVKRFRGESTVGDFTPGGLRAGRIRLLAGLFARTEGLQADVKAGATVINPATGEKFRVTGKDEQGYPVLAPEGGGPDVVVSADDLRLGKYRVDVAARNLRQLAQTLAHEIGHLVDWLPDKILKRGNLLGRLKSLHSFLQHTYTTQGGEIIHRDDIRDELIAVSKAWRGDFDEKGSQSYDRYRQRGKELYADAISALLNNPGWLEETAPVFYQEFFDHLDQKPDVYDAYFGLQELLSGTREELIQRRRAGVRGMFERGDMKAQDVETLRRAEQQEARKHLWSRLRIELVDKNTPVIDRVKALEKRGTPINPDDDPRYALKELRHLGALQQGFIARAFQPVYEAVQEAGIGWASFGEALFYERIIAGDRSEMANPRGLTVESARELYQALQGTLTPTQITALGKSVTAFRAGVREIAERAYQAGLYKPELYEQMQANPAWAAFRVIDHMEKDVTSKVHHQIGTLKDVQNPADATILKTLVTLRAIEYQEMKLKVFAALEQATPQDIEQAKQAWNGKGLVPVDPDDKTKVLIPYYEQGKLRGKYVPKDVADAVQNTSIGQNLAALEGLRLVNNRWFRPVFTTMNSGFQVANFFRDFWRYWSNMPDSSLAGALKAYGKAVPMARVRAFGPPKSASPASVEAEADLRAALEARVLGVTFNDLVAGRPVEDTQIEQIFARHGLEGPPNADISSVRDAAKAVLDFIAKVGDFIETLPKAAAIYELKGDRDISELTAEERAYIREKVGSPDFLIGGTLKPITNELLLFSNAITQAIRSDIEVATGPKTRGAFWRKNATAFMLPVALTFFVEQFGHLLAGGDDEDDENGWRYVQQILRGVSEYDKTNYTIVPLALDASGNSVYLRIPRSDAGRLLSGLFRKMLLAGSGEAEVLESLAVMFDYTAGQVPGTTPTLDLIKDATNYAAGQNVYDSFRNREVFSRDEMDAGGLPKAKKFLAYEFQQMGGGVVYRVATGEDRPREQTTAQKVLELPIVSNVVGRFVRVTNYGQMEQARKVQQEARHIEAKGRLAEKAAVADALRAYQKEPPPNQTRATQQRLARDVVNQLYADATPKERAAQYRDVLKKIRMGAARGKADPVVNTVMSATSSAQKVAIIREAFKDKPSAMSPWLRQAVREQVISGAVAQQAARQAEGAGR